MSDRVPAAVCNRASQLLLRLAVVREQPHKSLNLQSTPSAARGQRHTISGIVTSAPPALAIPSNSRYKSNSAGIPSLRPCNALMTPDLTVLPSSSELYLPSPRRGGGARRLVCSRLMTLASNPVFSEEVMAAVLLWTAVCAGYEWVAAVIISGTLVVAQIRLASSTTANHTSGHASRKLIGFTEPMRDRDTRVNGLCARSSAPRRSLISSCRTSPDGTYCRAASWWWPGTIPRETFNTRDDIVGAPSVIWSLVAVAASPGCAGSG